jgi:hypothetical protein
MTRSIDNRFINPAELTQMAAAAVTMRPSRDDIEKDYRKPSNCSATKTV